MTTAHEKLARIRAAADAAPIANWLGFNADIESDDIIYKLAFDEQHIGNVIIRALHGGAIAAFLEFSAQCALRAHIGDDTAMETVNTDIDYLRSSRPEDMKARVTLVRVGRRVAFLEATGWQKDERAPVAKARFRISLSGGGT